jgi:hypothetical protein
MREESERISIAKFLQCRWQTDDVRQWSVTEMVRRGESYALEEYPVPVSL